MLRYEYIAIRVRQEQSDRSLLLFSAPAVEIDEWAGVPQKKQIGPGAETTGFQREVKQDRIVSLKAFYHNPKNVIQNPLLCATRESQSHTVHFLQDDPASPTGKLVIEILPLEQHSLLALLSLVKSELEQRVPSLASETVPAERLTTLKELAQIPSAGHSQPSEETEENAEPSERGENTGRDGDEDEVVGSVFSDESHIFDFWVEVAARKIILEQLGSDFSGEEFLGYTKTALITFLRPIVIVDGQHRLRGALEAAKERCRENVCLEQIEQAIASGQSPDDVRRRMELGLCRSLPVSLLLTQDPAEHVFQFVVVNQKATPIGRALLGTIVATTLSLDEMERVSTRLRDAGIPLEQSRAVAFLSRHDSSPFKGLVERGLTTDAKGLLPWSVLALLIRIFQELKDGNLFGQKNDYAKVWRRKHLADSPIVADWQEKGFGTPYDYWSHYDGPWREVFITFWRETRDFLGNVSDPAAGNYWGRGRESNLFNKISLTILEADFFSFLCEGRGTVIESADQVAELVKDWLEGISPTYFNRDWQLEGIKKDSVGIRVKWAELWEGYRRNPEQVPDRRSYRQPARI
jgi:hypothetical protein